jgi:hypothetical protein
MEHRGGTNWLATELSKASKAHPKIEIAYDPIGFNVSVAQTLGRIQRFNSARLRPLTLKEIGAAAAFISQSLSDGTLRHTTSASMDTAASSVVWRWSGEVRLFGRKNSAADISALCAGSAALFVASGMRNKAPRKPREAVLL